MKPLSKESDGSEGQCKPDRSTTQRLFSWTRICLASTCVVFFAVEQKRWDAIRESQPMADSSGRPPALGSDNSASGST